MRDREKALDRILAECFEENKQCFEEQGAKNACHPKCKSLTIPIVGDDVGKQIFMYCKWIYK